MKPLFFTQHAQDAIDERELELDWIERAVRDPDWSIADPRRPGVERRFRRVRQPRAARRLL
jgi:hypothetical protein